MLKVTKRISNVHFSLASSGHVWSRLTVKAQALRDLAASPYPRLRSSISSPSPHFLPPGQRKKNIVKRNLFSWLHELLVEIQQNVVITFSNGKLIWYTFSISTTDNSLRTRFQIIRDCLNKLRLNTLHFLQNYFNSFHCMFFLMFFYYYFFIIYLFFLLVAILLSLYLNRRLLNDRALKAFIVINHCRIKLDLLLLNLFKQMWYQWWQKRFKCEAKTVNTAFAPLFANNGQTKLLRCLYDDIGSWLPTKKAWLYLMYSIPSAFY